MAQYTYLSCQDLGENLDETLALLKKHITFERALMTQEERFEALKKLTTLELRAREASLETQKQKELDKKQRIKEATREFQPPPTPKIQKLERSLEPEAALEAETAGQQMASSAYKPSGAEADSADQPTTSKQPSSETHEGVLSRKHEWENANKKASGRSWHELYVCLSDAALSAYKDQRHCKDKPAELYHHEAPLQIAGAKVAPATDYTKRPHVFRLRLANGGEFLFQTRSEADMNEWITRLNNAAGTGTDGGDSAAQRSHTLPSQQHGASADTGDSHHGKKKFFTLGRKK